MATRRRSIHNTSGLNFRPSTSAESKQEQPRGTKPTTEQSSIKEVLGLMMIHLCKKSLFFDTNLKVGLYLAALFLLSLIADVIIIPKSYLSRSDNAINQYFVKFAWGWNLTILVPYVVLTSSVYCCGNIRQMIKHHLIRIAIATFFWWLWTTIFNVIEANYGRCSTKSFDSKQTCLKNGYHWNGFDLSGHCFILIYGSLLLIEECRSMNNWSTIKDCIRLEEHHRINKLTSENTNILRGLSNEQFSILKINYEKYTPYIRSLFILITIFQILWDVMLICTMLYYHIMIEKFLGGAIAILTWFFTYRFWYKQSTLLPKLPGEGIFKYHMKPKTSPFNVSAVRKRTSLNTNGQSTFMGMPLRVSQSQESAAPVDKEDVR
ncbi:acyl-coenzyme A diphosphatase FITM2 [Onthophagus taurus]|uniref:acyl-coenzyme A diphosphatase FITM2 n=1 Tax=Onthophagus taurus TaxID=166361 RepID=UPI000C203295|nr:FIT family protein CG10671 [Onthophagus taurus]XP_022917416.1 FIT family protein CG10671 [Onthophagus taurus]XP_022917417.1 FIT family protein CG10671 [Onthophagus taurus]